MITDSQKKWLEELMEGKITKKDNSHKYSVYMNRIRANIDHEFENLLWLAKNYPDILEDQEWELEKYGKITNRRLKMLLQAIKFIYPEVDPQLIRLQREVGLPTSF